MRRYHGQIRRAHRWFSLQKDFYCSEFGLGAAGSYPRFLKEVLFILIRAGLAALWSTYLSPPAPICLENSLAPCESCRKAVVKGAPPLVSANVSLLLFSSWKLIVWSVATSANRAKCHSYCRPRQGVAIIGNPRNSPLNRSISCIKPSDSSPAAARPPETFAPSPPPLPSLRTRLQTGVRDEMLSRFC